jgi:chemotaxis protein methyltransferase CheR
MTGGGAPISQATFQIIAKFLQEQTGIVLTEGKLYLIESRLRPVMQQRGIETLADLASQLLVRNPGSDSAAGAVIEAMTTNETFFFRDDKPFTHLRDVALPALHRSRPPGKPIRIWSAASSSGQEAYSICMVIKELGATLGDRGFEILGTDLSREQVERARLGLYSHFEVQRGLPVQLLVKYFDRSDKWWQIKQALRDQVSFRYWNLLHDPSRLGCFDIIFCRNVLIYFDRPTKTHVLQRLAAQLAPDGWVYLGGAETIVGLSTPFVTKAGEAAIRLGSPAGPAFASVTSQRPETIRSTSSWTVGTKLLE